MEQHPRAVVALAIFFLVASASLPSCLLAVQEGAEVRLSIAGAVEPATSADGVAVALDEVFLHVESAELVACDGAEANRGFPLGPSVARAHHGHSDGTVLATPHLVALHGAPADLGRFHPPPGRYCGVRLAVTPAASSTPDVTEAMEGWSLSGHGALGGTARDVYGYGIETFELPLSAPLVVAADRLDSAVTVDLDVRAAIAAVDAGDAELFGGDLLYALPEHAAARETPAD